MEDAKAEVKNRRCSKKSQICIIGVLTREEKGNEAEAMFEVIRAKKFPKAHERYLIKNSEIHIDYSQYEYECDLKILKHVDIIS